jgi:hypothetical protein
MTRKRCLVVWVFTTICQQCSVSDEDKFSLESRAIQKIKDMLGPHTQAGEPHAHTAGPGSMHMPAPAQVLCVLSGFAGLPLRSLSVAIIHMAPTSCGRVEACTCCDAQLQCAQPRAAVCTQVVMDASRQLLSQWLLPSLDSSKHHFSSCTYSGLTQHTFRNNPDTLPLAMLCSSRCGSIVTRICSDHMSPAPHPSYSSPGLDHLPPPLSLMLCSSRRRGIVARV